MSPIAFRKTMLYAPSNFCAEVAEDLDQVGPVVAAQLVAEVVHDDFGVGVARQVVVGSGEQFVAQLGEVGELAVEGEGEPLPLAAVAPLERLGVAAAGRAAGGVADVADGGPAGVLLHDRRRTWPDG